MQTVGPPEIQRRFSTSDDEELLQLWVVKRTAPNDAEMRMLSAYLGEEIFDIYDWCK